MGNSTGFTGNFLDMLLRGTIKSIITSDNRKGDFAEVIVDTNKIIPNVFILNPHNTKSFPKVGDPVIVLSSFGDNTIACCLLLQNIDDRPSIKETEYIAGNFDKDVAMHFKEDASIDFGANASVINVGGASAPALNTNADMQITIPSGSSAGTYTVVINNSGQNSDTVKI